MRHNVRNGSLAVKENLAKILKNYCWSGGISAYFSLGYVLTAVSVSSMLSFGIVNTVNVVALMFCYTTGECNHKWIAHAKPTHTSFFFRVICFVVAYFSVTACRPPYSCVISCLLRSIRGYLSFPIVATMLLKIHQLSNFVVAVGTNHDLYRTQRTDDLHE